MTLFHDLALFLLRVQLSVCFQTLSIREDVLFWNKISAILTLVFKLTVLRLHENPIFHGLFSVENISNPPFFFEQKSYFDTFIFKLNFLRLNESPLFHGLFSVEILYFSF